MPKHHIKLLRVQNDLHRGVVHEHVVYGYLGVPGCKGLYHLAPKPRSFQHVCLVYQGQLFPALLCGFESQVRNALDLLTCIHAIVRSG